MYDRRPPQVLKVCAFQLNFQLPFELLVVKGNKSTFAKVLSNLSPPPRSAQGQGQGQGQAQAQGSQGGGAGASAKKKGLQLLLKIARSVATDSFSTVAWCVRTLVRTSVFMWAVWEDLAWRCVAPPVE